MLQRLFTLTCGLMLFPLSNALGAEGFDVLVMRGSTLVRVTGDENGTTSEVTIREDPTPRAPEIVWEEPEVRADPVALVIQVFQDAPRPAWGWGFGHGHSAFGRHDRPHHGSTRAMNRGKRNPNGFVHHGSAHSSRSRTNHPHL